MSAVLFCRYCASYALTREALPAQCQPWAIAVDRESIRENTLRSGTRIIIADGVGIADGGRRT
jgi:hypothetical protein